MTREEAKNYLKSSGMTEEQIETVINAFTCEDCISREAVLEKAIIVPIAKVVTEDKVICRKIVFVEDIQNLPSVTPKFTDAEIQKMQELEQVQLEKAHELGRAEVQPCEDCISRKDVMAIIEWAYDECKIDGYTDYCEMCDMVKGLPSVKPKAERDENF